MGGDSVRFDFKGFCYRRFFTLDFILKPPDHLDSSTTKQGTETLPFTCESEGGGEIGKPARHAPATPARHAPAEHAGTRAVFPNQRGGNTEHGNTELGTHP